MDQARNFALQISNDKKTQNIIEGILSRYLFVQCVLIPDLKTACKIISNYSIDICSTEEMNLLKSAGIKYHEVHIILLIDVKDFSILDSEFWNSLFPISWSLYDDIMNIGPDITYPGIAIVQNWVRKKQNGSMTHISSVFSRKRP
jgi:hypothetical protein